MAQPASDDVHLDASFQEVDRRGVAEHVGSAQKFVSSYGLGITSPDSNSSAPCRIVSWVAISCRNPHCRENSCTRSKRRTSLVGDRERADLARARNRAQELEGLGVRAVPPACLGYPWTGVRRTKPESNGIRNE